MANQSTRKIGPMVNHCYSRTPKIELGASKPNRLGIKMLAGGEGKGRGDGEQLLTNRLKTLDQGVLHSNARMPKIEPDTDLLDRLGTLVIAGVDGKGRGDGEQWLTSRLEILD